MQILKLKPKPIGKKMHSIIDKIHTRKNNLLNEQLKKRPSPKKTPIMALHKFAYNTKSGHDPHNPYKINQDIYITHPNVNLNSRIHFFAVADGHGQYGLEIAMRIKCMLPRI
jgi:hypothetical protein